MQKRNANGIIAHGRVPKCTLRKSLASALWATANTSEGSYLMQNYRKGRENVEVDLQKLLIAYVQKWWAIVLSALIIAAGSLWYTMNYVEPQYQATVTIYVNNNRTDVKDEISNASLVTSQRLVKTYVNIIKSETVLNRVVKNSDLSYTAAQLRGMLSAEQVEETEIFRIIVTNGDPEEAADVANAIAREGLDGIEAIVDGSSAKVVDYASVPQYRSSPNLTQNTVLGGLVGILLAVVAITIQYLMDVRVKTAADLEQMFEIPLLGQIPVFVSPEAKEKRGYGYGYSRRRYGYTRNGYGYESESTAKKKGGVANAEQ